MSTLLYPPFPGKQSPQIDKLPIIYSSKYNMSVLGLENLHPFDTKKFKKIYRYLLEHMRLNKQQFYQPFCVSDEILQVVHTTEYLKSLDRSTNIARIAELYPLMLIPSSILKRGILEPMRYATGGTILATELALKCGWAINLSGGYHHAKTDEGEGFCFFADIPIAIKVLWKERGTFRPLIIDLDAHQGNGVSSILGTDARVAILDVYNSDIFPNDTEAEQKVKYRVPIKSGTEDTAYLDILNTWVPKAIKEHRPDIIVYNAGTDIYDLDPLGGLSITGDGIVKRDAFVFRNALERKIPILMLLAGGYQKQSGLIIGRSIENLLRNVLNGAIIIQDGRV